MAMLQLPYELLVAILRYTIDPPIKPFEQDGFEEDGAYRTFLRQCLACISVSKTFSYICRPLLYQSVALNFMGDFIKNKDTFLFHRTLRENEGFGAICVNLTVILDLCETEKDNLGYQHLTMMDDFMSWLSLHTNILVIHKVKNGTALQSPEIDHDRYLLKAMIWNKILDGPFRDSTRISLASAFDLSLWNCFRFQHISSLELCLYGDSISRDFHQIPSLFKNTASFTELKLVLTEPSQVGFVLESGIFNLPKRLEHFHISLEFEEQNEPYPGDVIDQLQSKAKDVMKDLDIEFSWSKPTINGDAFTQLCLGKKAPS